VRCVVPGAPRHGAVAPRPNLYGGDTTGVSVRALGDSAGCCKGLRPKRPCCRPSFECGERGGSALDQDGYLGAGRSRSASGAEVIGVLRRPVFIGGPDLLSPH
jgi:hypothetical protein